ncbi:hypothetical protein ACH5RR_035071 [Cinchona calisaya]|uniref:TF-B3 domain-containing protein n=1 Tax=Cinchona calisaya TaxID=153742 RepID=A0ABD2YGB2_9GENT
MSTPVIRKFFKFLAPGFETELRLPPLFCRRLRGKIPNVAIIQSCKGSWRVRVRKSSNGLLTLCGNGWASFVSHHDLKFGELLFFKHTGQMLFKTYIFQHTACEKEFSVAAEEQIGLDHHHHENTQFTITIQPHNLKRDYLTIPSTFVKSNFLDRITSVSLRNTSGDAWRVKLRFYGDSRKTNPDHAVLNCGWREFCKSNKLKTGDVCVFELVERRTSLGSAANAVMDVTVV